jgi:type IV pilus assembly protein PilM
MGLFIKSKPLIGLDIGSNSIKAVELTKSRNGYELSGFAAETLVPDSVVDGAIIDSRAVADAIKRVLESGKFKPKGFAPVFQDTGYRQTNCRTGATNEEVDASIQFDAEQHIPFQIADVNMDYQVIGPWEREI